MAMNPFSAPLSEAGSGNGTERTRSSIFLPVRE
jgi:hypothetical protein